MTIHHILDAYNEILEYHGSTTVERIRRQGCRIIWREWIEFDSVEDAQAYFNDAAVAA